METRQVHTLVLHRHPDLEALFMAWLIWRHSGLRKRFGINDSLRFKFISPGALKPEEWGIPLTASELSAKHLEEKGYLFLDCGGDGASLDQHSAVINRGKGQDVATSIDLLVGETGVLETDPAFLPFVRVVSDNDRAGLSICSKPIFDKSSDTPHVPRDVRTMVEAINDRYPDDPEKAQKIFFRAMDGLFHLWGELVSDHYDRTDKPLDEALVDLREVDFMTVDNAAEGYSRFAREKYKEEGLTNYANGQLVKLKMDEFWGVIREAWQHREADWCQATVDVRRAQRKRATYVDDAGTRTEIWVIIGKSDSRFFPVIARRQKCDVTIQFYSDGRFLITRRGHSPDFDRVAKNLRLADALKRGGQIIDMPDKAARNTTSFVAVGDNRIAQFYYPSGGFAFGNRWSTNPGGLSVSVLEEDEVVRHTLLSLQGKTTKAVRDFGLNG